MRFQGSPWTSFTFICRPISFRGLLGPQIDARVRGLRDAPLESCTDPWGFGVWSPRPSIKLIYKAIRFQAPLGSCSIYIQVHGSSGSPETSFKLIDMQAHEISGSLNNLLHIYIQAHEAARSLGTFFQIYLQAHEISGVRETSFTHHMQAHLFFGVSLILLQIDGQVHMRFQGPLGRPSNLYTGP